MVVNKLTNGQDDIELIEVILMDHNKNTRDEGQLKQNFDETRGQLNQNGNETTIQTNQNVNRASGQFKENVNETTTQTNQNGNKKNRQPNLNYIEPNEQNQVKENNKKDIMTDQLERFACREMVRNHRICSY